MADVRMSAGERGENSIHLITGGDMGSPRGNQYSPPMKYTIFVGD